MKFSPCISALYNNSGLNWEQKLRQIHAIGYRAFEFWKWWEADDPERIRRLSDSLNMQVGAVCTKFVTLTDPERRDDYIAGLRESIEAAKILGTRYLISQTGNHRPGVPREEQAQSLVDGLRAVVPYLRESGITLVVEPLNTLVNHPGYFLETSKEAFEIIDRVGSEQVKVLFDIYHQQITEGNLIPNIVNHIDRIAYFHVADHPGRHEPGTGEINYRNVFEAIRKTGFEGFIGLEYTPQFDAEQSLKQFWNEFGSMGR